MPTKQTKNITDMRTYEFHSVRFAGIGTRRNHFIQAETKAEAVRKFRDHCNARGTRPDGTAFTLDHARSLFIKRYNE